MVGMAGYASRAALLDRPSEQQRKFLERLRDLGPQNSVETAMIPKATKRACQVRGWVEWKRLDGLLGLKVWYLTMTGRRALLSK